ncbi:MAG: DUF2279 domain-containing protein [Flavitalea sp.]
MFCFSFPAIIPAHAQENITLKQKKQRLWMVTGANAVLWTGSFVALNSAWYAGYPRSSFHFFNDNAEWNQMDKAGHLWTSYQVSRVSAEAWKWTGLNNKQSAVLGGVSGIVYQSIIEIQDGFSSEWGFSWGDLAANIAGAGAYVSQEIGWKDQRIQVKLSYWPYRYPTGLENRTDQLFGKSMPERILKDYNSQTYWVSANLGSFLPDANIPKWLNISLGYGADGMLGARKNIWMDKDGNRYDYSGIGRVRKFFLSPDIDLTRIPTRSKWLKSILFTLNMIKVPAPALELNSKGKWRLRPLHF